MGHSQAVQNLCPPGPREESAACPLHSQGPSTLLPFPFPSLLLSLGLLPGQFFLKPHNLILLPDRAREWSLTEGGLPGLGPNSCRKAWKYNSRSSNGPHGPRRRRNPRLAQETLGAGPLVPHLSSCIERQNSQRECQTGPVGTPKMSYQFQNLLDSGHQCCSCGGPPQQRAAPSGPKIKAREPEEF